MWYVYALSSDPHLSPSLSRSLLPSLSHTPTHPTQPPRIPQQFDLKNRRTFLKRCSYPSISLSDLYIGAQVTVYARQLRILSFGDTFTTSKLNVSKSKSLAVIKPNGYETWGKILIELSKGGYKLGRMKSIILTSQQAQQFYGDRTLTQRSQELAQGPILAIEIVGAGAQATLLKATQNGEYRDVYVADSERTGEVELDFLFSNPSLRTTATFSNCTLALIKPHAIQAGHTGAIIDAILRDGFDISALELFNLDKTSAEEFLDVYKGVVPEYYNIIEQLVSGSVIALEIRAPQQRLEQEQSSIVQAFRMFTGPSDPEVARHIRPRTLRAVFGQNKIKNGLHCTDLEEDGVLESQFFFEILQQPVQPQGNPATIQAAQQRR